MGRAGPRPMRNGLYMNRSARPMRRPACFHRPAPSAAQDMWCTAATKTTMSTRPMRRPTRFRGPTRAAGQNTWSAVQYKYKTVRTDIHLLFFFFCLSGLCWYTSLASQNPRTVTPPPPITCGTVQIFFDLFLRFFLFLFFLQLFLNFSFLSFKWFMPTRFPTLFLHVFFTPGLLELLVQVVYMLSSFLTFQLFPSNLVSATRL